MGGCKVRGVGVVQTFKRECRHVLKQDVTVGKYFRINEEEREKKD